MMKKFSISGCLIALALFLATADAYGQRQPRRNPGARRGVERVLGIPNPARPQVRSQRLTAEQRRQVQQRLMREIGLSDNQRLRMAEIQRSHEDERISAGRRLRQARQALERAIRSEQFDENRINQFIEELAAAQADKIRLDARVRAQMRGVLTSDQMLRLNQLELRLRRQMRQQQQREMRDNDLQDRNDAAPREPGSEEPFDLISFLFSQG
jgi:Spy/CpxP family protein refolding chaperone